MMRMTSITLELPDDIAAGLSEAAAKANRSPEAVAQDLLRRIITLQNVERLRAEVRDSLGPDAPRSEAEAFEQIS